VLLFHVTRDGDLHTFLSLDRKECLSKQDIQSVLRDQLKQLLGDEAESIMKASNRPVRVLQLMGKTIREAKLNAVDENRFDREVKELERVLGACERILRTPIPTSYTRHTSRFLFAWVYASPFMLWPMCGVWTSPAAVTLAYFMLGIEDIGVTVEEPFDILPLWRVVEAIDESSRIAEDSLCKKDVPKS